MAKTSAAYIIAIVAVTAGIIGALLLTVTDPVMQALFDSAMWSSSTKWGTMSYSWGEDVWNYWPVFILVGILTYVFISSRQATRG